MMQPLRLNAALLPALLTIAVASTASAEAPRASPARLLPARGLTFYVEYDGLDAHAEAWEATSAYEIVGRTPAGAMMADVARKTLDRLLRPMPGDVARGADLVALQDHVVHRGFALGSYGEGAEAWKVFILDGFGDEEDRDRFDRWMRLTLKPKEGESLATSRDLRGRKVFSFPGQSGSSWWLEGDALVAVQGPVVGVASLSETLKILEGGVNEPQLDLPALHRANVEAVIDAIEGKAPNASTNPGVVAARAEGRDLDGFEPNGLFAALSRDDDGVLEALHASFGGGGSGEFDVAATIGLNQAKRVIGRWGFRGKALLTDVRFEDAGEWKGLVGMLDPSGFSKEQLPAVVRGKGAVAVGSFRRGLDPDSLAVLHPLWNDDTRPYVEAAEGIYEDPGNRQALTALVETLGPTWSACAEPLAVLVEIKNAARTEARLDAAAARLNVYFREQERGEGVEAKPDDPPPALVLERLPAPDRGYRLISPDNRVPWLSDAVQPTILLDTSFVVFAINPASARAAADGGALKLSGESARASECLPANLALLIVGDPRDSFWPDWIADFRGSTASFFGYLEGVEPRLAPSDVLTKLGVRPPPPTARKENIKADAIRASIFPSVLAATVDDRSVRFVSQEALPLGCISLSVEGKADGKITIKAATKP